MSAEAPEVQKLVAVKSKRIFLSHASKDKALADALADLLTSGCAVNPNDILCTSLEGKGVPTGAPSFIEFLRGQIQKPELVILLLSENFFASHFCMCELGAVWGMGLLNFPLVVPGTERGKLKAVLTVAQAGEVNSKASLDELRDTIKDRMGTGVPTAIWTVKRDAFLGQTEDIIKSLGKPDVVSASELQRAQDNYQAALAEIKKKEIEARNLNARISDLEQCKDRADVLAVLHKHSSAKEHFGKLTEEANFALKKVHRATAAAIFFELRGDNYYWEGKDEFESVTNAHQVQEVILFDRSCKPNIEHIRVQKAKAALRALSVFLSDAANSDFVAAQEEDLEFPMEVKNKEFWSRVLKVYF